MKLNKDTRHTVEIGDVLRFSDKEAYVVTEVMSGANGRTFYFTLADIRTKQHIYGMKSSALYGAEIIKDGIKNLENASALRG